MKTSTLILGILLTAVFAGGLFYLGDIEQQRAQDAQLQAVSPVGEDTTTTGTVPAE